MKAQRERRWAPPLPEGQLQVEARLAMRDRPPDPTNGKGLPRWQTRTGPDRKRLSRQRTQIGRPAQSAANPGRQVFSPRQAIRRSLRAIIAGLRDDDCLPLRLRTAAAQAAHTLAVGGKICADDEQQLRRLHVRRRRQLAALSRMHGIRP